MSNASPYVLRRDGEVLRSTALFTTAWRSLVEELYFHNIVGCHLNNPPGRPASATITIRVDKQRHTYTIAQE